MQQVIFVKFFWASKWINSGANEARLAAPDCSFMSKIRI
jgi:hypothetical protein